MTLWFNSRVGFPLSLSSSLNRSSRLQGPLLSVRPSSPFCFVFFRFLPPQRAPLRRAGACSDLTALWDLGPLLRLFLLSGIFCPHLCRIPSLPFQVMSSTHVCPAQKSGLLPAAPAETSLPERGRGRVWCRLLPGRPQRWWPGAPGACVPDRQLDCLLDKMEQKKANLPNGAIDHCHNMQPAVAWKGHILEKSSRGGREFLDTRLLRDR